jgi:ATP-dependent exoDNAse (exonuclease V) beta subunit
VPFSIPIERGFAVGRVDLVFPGDTALTVIDYKTDLVPVKAAETHAMKHHAAQAHVYASALREATGVDVRRTVFVYCRPNVEVAVANGH